jgi:hypothetical protein|nr:MAG TPA: hypothetical protein [Bacteriophage sp.]
MDTLDQVEYVDIDKANEEYEKITGKKEIEGIGIKDESLEAFITDPNLILRDVKELCEKHEIDFVGMFNEMGFNKNTFKALLVNKPITEQIYVLNRELNLLIYKLGVASGISTLNARTLLGDVLPSKEWLELLDKTIFPYMSEYGKNGKLDKDWFVKNEQEDEIEELAESLRDLATVQGELVKEAEKANQATVGLFDEEENLSLTQGEETVTGEFTTKEVNQAIEETQQDGEITVEEDTSVEEPKLF